MNTTTPEEETTVPQEPEEDGVYYRPHPGRRRTKERRQEAIASFTADYRQDGAQPVKTEPKKPEQPAVFSMDYRDASARSHAAVPAEQAAEQGALFPHDQPAAAPQTAASPEQEEGQSAADMGESGVAPVEDNLFGGASPEEPQSRLDMQREEPRVQANSDRGEHAGPRVVLSHPRKRKGRRRYGVAVGTIVLLLALVGVVFLAVSLGQTIHSKLSDDSYLRDYDRFLAPVVMQDPVPFEQIASANPEMVMTASLWRAIFDKGGEGYANYDQEGRSLVPLADVQAACLSLFGPDCTLQPQSPAEESFFTYSAEDQQFHVAPYSTQSAYSAYTESAKKDGELTVLRVGYVSPADDYRADPTGQTKPTPVKWMEYLLKANPESGDFYVYAVRSAQ